MSFYKLKTATRSLTVTEAYWEIEFGSINAHADMDGNLFHAINSSRRRSRCSYGWEIQHRRGLGRSQIECWEVRPGLWLWRVQVRERHDISKRWNSPYNDPPIRSVLAVGIADDKDEGLRLARATALRAAKDRKQKGVTAPKPTKEGEGR